MTELMAAEVVSQPPSALPDNLNCPHSYPARAQEQPQVRTPVTPLRRVPDTHGALEDLAGLGSHGLLGRLADLRPLGQRMTVSSLPPGAMVYGLLIKHVAHERILFEQVLRAPRRGQTWKCQHLLMPLCCN